MANRKPTEYTNIQNNYIIMQQIVQIIKLPSPSLRPMRIFGKYARIIQYIPHALF